MVPRPPRSDEPSWRGWPLRLLVGAIPILWSAEVLHCRRPHLALCPIRKEGMVAIGKVVFTSREHIIALE
jgi:hypothetical protein